MQPSGSLPCQSHEFRKNHADLHIVLPLKRFLLIEQCPATWQTLDLYLFRDDAVAFYVGQSHVAFDRVWEHLRNGFKGRSVVGRFIWSNWPKSLSFTRHRPLGDLGALFVADDRVQRGDQDGVAPERPAMRSSLTVKPAMAWSASTRRRWRAARCSAAGCRRSPAASR
jgi:hypothetical protein